MKHWKLTLTTLFLAAPAWLSAHSGHGKTEGSSLLHYLLEPQHLVIVLSTLLVTVLIVRFGLQRRRARAKSSRDA